MYPHPLLPITENTAYFSPTARPEQHLLNACALQSLLVLGAFFAAHLYTSMDYQESKIGDRSANGLYYGATVLYCMDGLVGFTAVLFGIHSGRNWNARSAYYHFIATFYTLFCSLLEITVSIYLLQHAANPKGDTKTWLKVGVLINTVLFGVVRLGVLHMSQTWQSVLHQRQMLRIDAPSPGRLADLGPSAGLPTRFVITPKLCTDLKPLQKC